MREVITISDNINDLKGSGLEYLVINEIVLAKFFNGNIVGNMIGYMSRDTIGEQNYG